MKFLGQIPINRQYIGWSRLPSCNVDNRTWQWTIFVL